jgi:hypothetical protein
MVILSRISPIRITSGSWRSTERKPVMKESVSVPMSRCVIDDSLSR